MSFIALKLLFLAEPSISDNKNWDEIFSGKSFFTEILLNLFNNRNQLKNEISFLTQQSISDNKRRDKEFSDKNFSWKFFLLIT